MLVPDANHISEKSRVLQSILKQILTNHTLIPYFSLSCKPRLEDSFYQKLKEWVAHEDDYIDDNYNELKEQMNPDNEGLQN